MTESKDTIKNARSMMYGLDAKVQYGSGKMAPMVNLDNAATTPPFKAVVKEIHEQLLLYGSIGRSVGQKSKHSSIVYTEGRDAILNFLGANKDKYTVFYAHSTTDGINKLASALINTRDKFGYPRHENILIVSTRMEHHSNDLPWRERVCITYADDFPWHERTGIVYADVNPENGRLILEDFERLLNKEEYSGMVKYVTVTAASNVTGYINDVHAIARIAHKCGAKIIVDGTQIVAHREFSMLGRSKEEDIDFFVFSAHKMYSPYGGGAVVGLKDVLNDRMPKYYGGGMVLTVNDNSVIYADEPDLYEAGSPNVPGIIGMLKAIEMLTNIGFDNIKRHERLLLGRAIEGLSKIKGVTLYGDNRNIEDRVGILLFNLDGISPENTAKELAQRSGIAVRHGAFCAHPYVRRLMQKAEGDSDVSCERSGGMVRVSFGIYNTEDDVDLLIRTVKEIMEAFPVSSEVVALMREEVNLPNDRG